MLPFVFPLFPLCWLCSFVVNTIAAENLLQGRILTNRGGCAVGPVNQIWAIWAIGERAHMTPVVKHRIGNCSLYNSKAVILIWSCCIYIKLFTFKILIHTSNTDSVHQPNKCRGEHKQTHNSKAKQWLLIWTALKHMQTHNQVFKCAVSMFSYTTLCFETSRFCEKWKGNIPSSENVCSSDAQ